MTEPERARASRIGVRVGIGALLLGLGALALLALRRPVPPVAASPPIERFVQGGVAVEVTVEPVDPAARALPVHEGQDVTVRVAVTDAASGAALGRVAPAAWIDRRAQAQPTDEATCGAKVRAFLGASTLGGGQLDLTTFQVLILNDDATIAVVDPRFSFGGSKLLTMVFLRSPGTDWALTRRETALFVAMPAADRIALVDPASFQVAAEIALDPGFHPTRLALQPDEGYLWVVGGSEGGEASRTVTVIATATRAIAARIKVGEGRHAIAFSGDSRVAFVTNRDAGTVSLIDVAALSVLAELPTGRAPSAVAFSSSARAAYVTNTDDGTIAVIDPTRRAVIATIPGKPGITSIAFERKGRFGFIPNPDEDVVQIVDASANRVVQTGQVRRGPDQIAFSDTLAYVRHRGSEEVLMIPLDQVDSTDKAMAVADFPSGQLAPGSAPLAQAIVDAPGEPAVLVVNAADKAVYYYREGMAAPMGSFDAYGHVPRAVLVLDRSLREQRPGVYETTARLDRAGRADLALLISTPRLIHCFPLDIAPDPARPAATARPVTAELLTPARSLVAGTSTEIRLRLRDPATRAPVDGVEDLEVLTYLAPGVWQKRMPATTQGDGVYAYELRPPSEGAYYLALEAPSRGLSYATPQYLVLTATAAPDGGAR